MNKFLSIFIGVFCLGFALNCSSAKFNNIHYQREWMLVSFDQFTKEEMIEKKAGINLTAQQTNDELKGSATMGCNKIFFSTEFKPNGKIKISNVGSTEMVCQNMNLENAFLKKFTNMTHYAIEGHRLTLSDNQGNEMKFIAADWD